MRKPIYLDYAATTPVAPEVAQKMAECLTIDGIFANPASRSHAFGWQAEEKIETARGQVASLINADPREIVWTSGATEANNLALKGLAETYRTKHPQGGHLIVSAIEHKAVLDPAGWLETQGFSVTRLMPNAEGIVTAEQVEAALRADTFLVSVMFVNNELGSVNDIARIAAVCRGAGCFLHVDAAQAIGKLPVDVKALDVDLMSLSAHKFYGPKGIGVLFVKRAPQLTLAAQIHGGGHERNMRSGTLATHQCVGMGEAAALVEANLAQETTRIAQLRDRLWAGLKSLACIKRNGPQHEGVCGILNLAFVGYEGEMLLIALRDVAVSSGSACNSASMSPSYVLKAIGLSDAQAQASLRFSLGRYTTEEEIDFAVDYIRSTLAKLPKA